MRRTKVGLKKQYDFLIFAALRAFSYQNKNVGDVLVDVYVNVF